MLKRNLMILLILYINVLNIIILIGNNIIIITIIIIITTTIIITITIRYQFILASSAMPDYTWDILKYKFAYKIINTKISSTNDTASTFFMIFGGSSVTAGHDNYFNQSYPLVFERRMKPIFDGINIINTIILIILIILSIRSKVYRS